MDDHLDKHLAAYVGSLYDFDNSIMLNWYPKRVLDACKQSKSILELGLGHGYTTGFFSQHFPRHVVLEASTAIIDNFNEKYPNHGAEIIETHFEDFKTEEKFDVVMMGFILEHVTDPRKLLAHFKQFLKPGGSAFVAVPNAEVLNRRLGHLAGMLPDVHTLSENDLLLGHRRYYTVSSLQEEVRKAGFHLEKMEGIYLKPLTTRQLVSLSLDKRILDALCEVGIEYPELCCGILAQIK